MNIYKIIFLLFSVLSACSSLTHKVSDSYLLSLKAWSLTEKSYEGFSNTIQSTLVVYHPEFVRTKILEKANIYGWDQTKKQEQLNLDLAEDAKGVRAILAFYTSNRRLNQLTKKDSPWQIYLEVDGQQYSAKVKRNRHSAVELQSLYPNFTRWHIPYDLQFEIPTQNLMGKTFNIYIKGPMGHQKFTYSFL